MPISKKERELLEEENQTTPKEWKDTSGQMSEAESILRSFAIGGDYVLKTVSDTFEMLDPTGKSQSYEEATGNDLDEELRLLKEQSPVGETSGIAEATRFIVPAAAAGIPVERGFQVSKSILTDMLLGGVENLGVDIIMGEVKEDKAISNVDLDAKKVWDSFATGATFTAPISAALRVGNKSSEDFTYLKDEAEEVINSTRAKVDMTDEDLAEAFPDVRETYDVTKDIRDIAEEESVGLSKANEYKFDERDIQDVNKAEELLNQLDETMPNRNNRKMFSDFKRVQDGVEQDVGINIIKRYNKETFKGIDETEVTRYLMENNKLYQGLLKDTYEQLRQDLNIDRGIKQGEAETLFDPSFPDPTKAEELASIKASNKAQRVETAQDTAELQSKRNTASYELLKKELEEASIDYNKLATSELRVNPVELAMAERRLTEAMRRSKAFHGDGKSFVEEEMFNIGISPSKSDMRASDSGVGKSTVEINPKKAKEIIDDANIDNLYRQEGYEKVRAKVDEKKKVLADSQSNMLKKAEATGKISSIDKQRGILFGRRWAQESESVKHQSIVDSYGDKNFDKLNKLAKDLDIDVKVVDEIHDNYAGLARGNQILLKKGFTKDDFYHELTHVIAEEGLAASKKAQARLDYLRAQAIKNKVIKESDYANTDSFEFLAEVFSDKNLVAALKSDRNLWRDIKDAIVVSIKKLVGKDLSVKEIAREVDRVLDRVTTPSKSKIDDIASKIIDKDNINKMSNLMADVLDTQSAKSFRELYNITKKSFDSATRYKNTVEGMMDKALSKYGKRAKVLDKELYENLVKTDYASIKEFATKSQAMKYFKDNVGVYKKYSKEIEILAKSLGDSKHMNTPDWRGNGYAIMKKHGEVPEQATIDTIEKLVSIRAMKDANWDYIAVLQKKDKELFDLTMTLMSKKNEMSNKLFKDNPHDRIKGYMSEVYDTVDGEVTYKRGAIPPDIQSKTKGETKTYKQDTMTTEEFEEIARRNGLGILYKELDGVVEAIASRKVASEYTKVKDMGKQESFTQVIGATMSSAVRKQNINTFVYSKIDKMLQKDNGILNGDGNNFRPLTDEEMSVIPPQLRNTIRTIHKDYANQLIGNYEVGLREAPQAAMIAQAFLKDFVNQFKEAVVLKNPTSYVNNLMFNVAIGIQNGVPVKDMWKYHKEASVQFKEMRKLQNELVETAIKDGDIDAVLAKLKKLDVYQYSQKGLAMSVLADITSTPSYSKRVTERSLKKLIEGIVGKGELADNIGNISANLYLSPSAMTGKYLLELFTQIDVAGRYSLTKHNISKGMSMEDAVNKSNSIFGDLDKINPTWVQYLSEFGAVPFAGWFYRVSGGLSKNVKDNLPMAIGIAAILYGAQEASGKRTESFNPMLTIFNTPSDMLGMSPYLNIERTVESTAIPAIYKKIDEPSKMIMSDASF